MDDSDAERKIKVVLIEDNEDDALIFRQMLASHQDGCSFSLETAATLKQGRELLRQSSPDIVICDLSLPDNHDVNGIEKFQSEYPHIPLIILTGNADEKNAFHVLQKGIEDYLPKNRITPDVVIRAILYAIERKKIIVELDQTNEKLQGLIGKDPLTGVLNRRGLQAVLEKVMPQMQRVGFSVYALLLDFDDFKSINDKHSFRIGDLVLTEICQKIQEVIRNTDYVARLGGDEFLILLMNTREAEGQLVADKIRMKIAQMIFMTDLNTEVKATVSIGGGDLETDIRMFDRFLQRLHRALRTSKESGKNIATHWQESSSAAKNTTMKSPDLNERIFEEGCFYAVQQGIYDLARRQIVGYELLSRLSNFPDLAMPCDFFVYARQSNLLTGMDIRCLRECIKASRRLSAPIGRIHINLFPSTLLEVGWRGILNECQGADLGALCIELSEQQIIGNPASLTKDIQQLQANGISIAIDDVGFGRTSLESLVVVPPDLVKIDKSFVIGIAKDKFKQNNFERLQRIVQVCVSDYVIEGIETEEDLDFVVKKGCRTGQGYFFARPERL